MCVLCCAVCAVCVCVRSSVFFIGVLMRIRSVAVAVPVPRLWEHDTVAFAPAHSHLHGLGPSNDDVDGAEQIFGNSSPIRVHDSCANTRTTTVTTTVCYMVNV